MQIQAIGRLHMAHHKQFTIINKATKFLRGNLGKSIK